MSRDGGGSLGGGRLGLCADEPQRGSAMCQGLPGVQREAWVLIQALPSLPVCPWAGPQCPQLSPKGAGTTLCGHCGKECRTDRLKGHLSTHPPTPTPTHCSTFLRLLFNGCWREPGLFCKTLHTNTTPLVNSCICMWRDGLWEEMGGVGVIIFPT